MASRVGGTVLALTAAGLFAVTLATGSWWSGNPDINGQTISAKTVHIGVFVAQGCNTGGDGACKSLELGGGFNVTRYAVGAAAALSMLSMIFVALSMLKRSDRRKRFAGIGFACVVLGMITAIALLVQGPDLKTNAKVAVPLGWGLYIFGGASMLAIGAGLVAFRPLPPPPRTVLAPPGWSGTQPPPDPMASPDPMAASNAMAMMQGAAGMQPGMQHGAMPPSPGGILPGPSGPLGVGGPSTGPASTYQTGPQLRPLYDAPPQHGGTSGFVPQPVPPSAFSRSGPLASIPQPPPLEVPPPLPPRSKPLTAPPPVRSKPMTAPPPPTPDPERAKRPPPSPTKPPGASSLGADRKPPSPTKPPLAKPGPAKPPFPASGPLPSPAPLPSPPKINFPPIKQAVARPMTYDGETIDRASAEEAFDAAATRAVEKEDPFDAAETRLPPEPSSSPFAGNTMTDELATQAQSSVGDSTDVNANALPFADGSFGETTSPSAARFDASTDQQQTLGEMLDSPQRAATDTDVMREAKDGTPAPELLAQAAFPSTPGKKAAPQAFTPPRPITPPPPMVVSRSPIPEPLAKAASASPIAAIAAAPASGSPAATKPPISTAPESLPPPTERQAATSGPSPACPQCEAPMAWVEAHLRFYCKSCKMYF